MKPRLPFFLRKKTLFIFIVVAELIILIIVLFFLFRNSPTSTFSDNSNEAVHPYLGFVEDPASAPWLNIFGFPGELIKKNSSKDEYIVGIVGGSVSGRYYKMQEETLTNEIQKLLNNNKKVKIYSFGLGGYKQPQQLMVYTYLLSLGYRFDLIINIDGFNEAALGYAENYKNGISSYYPRSWNVYSKSLFNKETASLIADMEDLKTKIKFLSTLPNHLGDVPNKLLNLLYFQKQKQLDKYLVRQDKSYQVTGPEPYLSKSEEEVIKNIIDVWFNSSTQMGKLARENGATYLEFMQPNQYLPGTKMFSEDEKTKFINENAPYAYATKLIYPQILKRIEELREAGVFVYDLTDIYKNNSETLYIDDCCHYNAKGYAIMTNHIVDAIAEQVGR